MHICHLNMPTEVYSSETGGAVAHVIAQTSRELIRMGHRVSVVTPVASRGVYPFGEVVPLTVRRREDLSRYERLVSRARYYRHHWDWAYYDHHITAVRAALSRLDQPPDVILAHNDFVAPRWLKLTLPGAICGAWLHNVLPHSRQRRHAAGSADRVVVVSRYLAGWASGFGFPEEVIVVVPNSADDESFFPRDSWLERPDKLRVLFAGRIEPNKGADLVVDACAALRAEGFDIQLTVAGVGGLSWADGGRGRYWETIREAAARIDATWLGRVPTDSMPQVMRSQDVLCLPSRSAEGFGLVIAEAKASGLAVITSDRGGQVEAGGAAALLVHPENPGSVVDVLRTLASDPDALRGAKEASLREALAWRWRDSMRVLVQAL